MTFRVVRADTVWQGGFLSIEKLTVADGDGGEWTRRIVRHPGAVGIVVRDGDSFVLVEEWRPAFERSLIQIPAGKLDVDGEPPLACAQRELAEELGLAANSWKHLTSMATSPGFCDETIHIYLACDVYAVGRDPQSAEEAAIVERRIPIEDVPKLIRDGTIADAKTIVGLLLAMT